MKKFHSTISRRDFMKALGLAGAGLGAAAATTPVFHDLDEVIAHPSAETKDPWWVSRRDANDPTLEIDINAYVRWDRSRMYTEGYDDVDRDTVAWAIDQYKLGSGFSTAGKTMDDFDDMEQDIEDELCRRDFPGMGLRDLSLLQAINVRYYRQNWLGDDDWSTRGLRTAQQRNMPKYSGTPEENLRMLRVAGRFMGIYQVGALENNAFNKHFTWDNDGRSPGTGRKIIFTDDDEAYQDSDFNAVPNSCNYILPLVNRHAEQSAKAAPGVFCNASQRWAYFFGNPQYGRMMRFIKALGYKAYYNAWSGAQAHPVLSGLGEKGRPGLLLIPGRGALVRKMDSLWTDFPVSPETPIDAGMTKFCYSCKTCATNCPTGAIPDDTEPFWEVDGPWNAAGIKNWHFSYPTCGSFKSGAWSPCYCGMCIAVCPFSKFSNANIHSMVQAVAATTDLFNGFFTQMDRSFGYGKNLGVNLAHTEDNYVEEWWNTLGPEFGLTTFYGSYPTT